MTSRESIKYPGLRVRQLQTGTYAVERAATRDAYMVFNDPSEHIGSARRWHAVRRSNPTAPVLTARTKDDIMRALASGANAERRLRVG